MFIVGLTGGIGSGKSTVADRFVALGAALVDTDAIARELTAPGGAAIAAIRAHFGEGALRADGALDRDAMRTIAFSDAGAKAALEGILHPLIGVESARRCAAATAAPYVILAVPLLVETGASQADGSYRRRCDRILVVDCDEATQRARVVARSGLAEAEAQRIIAAQATRAARLAIADDVIDNNGTPDALAEQVAALHARYLAAAMTKVKENR